MRFLRGSIVPTNRMKTFFDTQTQPCLLRFAGLERTKVVPRRVRRYGNLRRINLQMLRDFPLHKLCRSDDLCRRSGPSLANDAARGGRGGFRGFRDEAAEISRES